MILDITKKQFQTKSPTRPYGKTADGSGSGDEEIFHVEFDPDVDSITLVIVRAIAAIRDVPPTKLSPLADSIDLDFLEKLVDPESITVRRAGEVTFYYEGFDITVDSDGDIWIERV